MQILKFAIGASEFDHIQELSPNLDHLTSLLLGHGVIHGFLTSLTNRRGELADTSTIEQLQSDLSHDLPKWCQPQWIDFLIQQIEMQLNVGQQQLNALSWLAKTITQDRRPLLVIKGAAVNDHLGRLQGLKPSSDMDILVPCVSAAWRTLVAADYSAESEEGTHEYAEFRRGGVALEIHRYFPLWRYPSEVREMIKIQDVFNSTGGNASQDPPYPLLGYDDLLASSHESRKLGTSIHVPPIELSAVILISHLLRDYIRSPLKKHNPVRLCDILDFHTLLQAQTFDLMIFLEYVELYSSEDALEFALWILAEIYGRDSYDEHLHQPGAISVFPRRIILDSVTVLGWYAPKSFSELLVRQDMPELMENIPTNRIYLNPGKSSAFLHISGAKLNSSDELFVSSQENTPELACTIKLLKSSERLGITVSLADYSAHYSYYFALYFPSELRLWSLVSSRGGLIQMIGNFNRNETAFDQSRRQFTCTILEHNYKWINDSTINLIIVMKRYFSDVGFDQQDPPTIAVPLSIATK